MQVTQRIWDDMLNVGSQSRYYQIIADRQQKVHLALSSVAILGSIAAATFLLSSFESQLVRWVSSGLFFAVTVSTTLTVIYDYSRRSQVARSASERLKEIEVDLRRLWYDALRDEQEDDENYLHHPEITELERRIDEVTRDDIPVNDKLNARCNNEAYGYLKSYFPEGASSTTTTT